MMLRLIDAVDYWKSKGILIDFIPYRIYEIGETYYFDFFQNHMIYISTGSVKNHIRNV